MTLACVFVNINPEAASSPATGFVLATGTQIALPRLVEGLQEALGEKFKLC